MSGTGSVERDPSYKEATEQARHGVEQVEASDTKGADELDVARRADPAAAEAAEQEASDGPEGRGLSR